MKNSILFLIAFSLIMISCKKENPDTPQVMNSENNVETLILNFKDKLENHLKDGTVYSADSAVWYVEGLLNYLQANNAHNFNALDFYYESVTLNSSNGEISISELNDAYIYFMEEITGLVNQANNPSLQIDLIDIKIIETNLKDGTVEMEMMASTGSESSILNYVQFGSDEYWYWGFNQGPCYINPSQLETDASNLLQYKFNHPISVGQGGWYTSVVYEDVRGDSYDAFYDVNNPGPYCYTMIFFYTPVVPPQDEACLSPDELNYYLSKFDFIKNYVQQNAPGLSGKTYKNVEVYDDVLYGYEKSGIHMYRLFYGTLNENPG